MQLGVAEKLLPIVVIDKINIIGQDKTRIIPTSRLAVLPSVYGNINPTELERNKIL